MDITQDVSVYWSIKRVCHLLTGLQSEPGIR